MLTRSYIEALLADAVSADRVWASWWAGEMDDAEAYRHWIEIAGLLSSCSAQSGQPPAK